MKKFKPVIGLEIHIELKTKAKMFCQCPAVFFENPPNTQTCPVCLGLPGALPVVNRQAVEWTVQLALALDCQIAQVSKFDRKHYFYPDLPKGYQISQYDQPIARQGVFRLRDSNYQFKKGMRIRRVHLEEDTGKLIHKGGDTLIDFNRSGVPLVEIVTEPDFENSSDVKRFLEDLQVAVRYLEISDANMERGTMRIEPNISVIKLSDKNKQKDPEKLKLPDYKVEVKNVNSFKFVQKAIEHEIKRQIGILKRGKIPKQETRGFSEVSGETIGQRYKEEAQDYRYFPEPDIPPMTFTKNQINTLRRQIPESPAKKMARFHSQYGVKVTDAFLLTRSKKEALFFEQVLKELMQNWEKLDLSKDELGQMLANLIINQKVSTKQSKKQFIKKAKVILKPKKTDIDLLKKTVSEVIDKNPKPVADYKKGKKNAIMFLVGQVMKKMKSASDPKLARKLLKDKLENKS